MANKKINRLCIFIVAPIILGVVFIVIYLLLQKSVKDVPQKNSDFAQMDLSTLASLTDIAAPVVADSSSKENVNNMFLWPLPDAPLRITKKPFGIKVIASHLSTNPERFNGYHVGADFEIFPQEENTAVSVNAVCGGPLLMKKWVNGYGGVAVQQCELDGDVITVVYGHLALDSVDSAVGDGIRTGQIIGVLGKGYTMETDGERKHLHLAMHKGKEIVILGYIQDSLSITDWLDPMLYINEP